MARYARQTGQAFRGCVCPTPRLHAPAARPQATRDRAAWITTWATTNTLIRARGQLQTPMPAPARTRDHQLGNRAGFPPRTRPYPTLAPCPRPRLGTRRARVRTGRYLCTGPHTRPHTQRAQWPVSTRPPLMRSMGGCFLKYFVFDYFRTLITSRFFWIAHTTTVNREYNLNID